MSTEANVRVLDAAISRPLSLSKGLKDVYDIPGRKKDFPKSIPFLLWEK